MIPDISYLILNYNPDGDHFAQDILNVTVDSFYQRKSKNLTCDVFLLDQGSPQGHRLWLLEKQRQHNFSTIFLNRNIGISRAINLFVRICKSPVVALITSDVIFTSGLDEDLYSKVQIPEIYQATSLTDKSDVNYQIWHPDAEFGADRLDLSSLNKQKKLLGRFIGQGSRRYLRVIGVEFNVMFWKKSLFEKIGYFDERWKACYENNDFSLRCFLAGGCTAISTESFVWHYHKTTEKNKSREKTYDNYVGNWPYEIRKTWDSKWPNLDSYIDIYKPLKNKDIANYPELYEKFKHNIYLPYEQNINYF